ncbi:MAG: hypothetical protein CSA75_02195 [Sorangium cellulosum]|nr:MAG: hypothetical protein CSA75_02195 [Sorangium cellulosum]
MVTLHWLVFALIAIAASVLAGCNKKSKTSDSAISTSPSATRELPEPFAFPDVLIPEGVAPNNGFTLDFRVRRIEDDAGKSYFDAAAKCIANGRMLCTETQWMRTCQAHPRVGKMQSWTASRRGQRAVVRGGKGCDDRMKVDGMSLHANRVGLCCERAVALRTSGDAGPWLGMGARLPRDFEAGLNTNDANQLSRVLGTQVVREGREWTRDELIEQEAKLHKAGTVHWTLFDLCRMRGGPVVVAKERIKAHRKHGILLSCRTVLSRADGVVDYDTRLGLVRPEGKGDYRLVQIEHNSSAIIPGAR